MELTRTNPYSDLLLRCVTNETIRNATKDTIGYFPPRGGVNSLCVYNLQPYEQQFELPTFEIWTALYDRTMGAGTVGSQEMKNIYDIITIIVNPPMWTFEYHCLGSPDQNTAKLIRWEFFRMLQARIPGEQFDTNGLASIVRPGSLTSKALRVYLAYCDEILRNSRNTQPGSIPTFKMTLIAAVNYRDQFVAVKDWFENGPHRTIEDIRILDFDLLFNRGRRSFSKPERRSENGDFALVLSRPTANLFCFKGSLNEPSPSFRLNLCASRLMYRKRFPRCFSRGLDGGWYINRDVQQIIKSGAIHFPTVKRENSQYSKEDTEKQLEAYYCWLSYNTRWSENLTEKTWRVYAVGEDNFDAAQEGPSCDWYLKMGLISEDDLLGQFSKLHKESGKTTMEIEAIRFLNTKRLKDERLQVQESSGLT